MEIPPNKEKQKQIIDLNWSTMSETIFQEYIYITSTNLCMEGLADKNS